ncbi:hypothetical protein ACFW04_005093 [Cataglyphis niger]
MSLLSDAEQALLLRSYKSILLVSSCKAGKYENVTPLCKRIIGFRVIRTPKKIFSCYRMWITRNEKYIDQNELGCRPIHVAGDIAFISIPCEVADKSRREICSRNRSTLIELFAYTSNERFGTHLPYFLTQ